MGLRARVWGAWKRSNVPRASHPREALDRKKFRDSELSALGRKV